MKRTLYLTIVVIGLGSLLSVYATAQSDGEVSLGDLARSLRKSKAPPAAAAPVVIDNDNLSQVMDGVESHKAKTSLNFSFDGSGKNFKVTSPDATCSLSFNAQSTALISDPFVPQDLPRSELVKLDGPATISGDTLQVSVYNGTAWKLKEITVGLTILRGTDAHTAYYGTAKLVPAAAGSAPPAEKRSDLTVLYHLKGTASPFTTAVFHEALGATLGAEQEWHWAIVQAKGIPPK